MASNNDPWGAPPVGPADDAWYEADDAETATGSDSRWPDLETFDDYTDTTFAGLLVAACMDEIRYTSAESWMVWRGTHWEESQAAVDRKFQGVIARLEVRAKLQDEETRKAYYAVKYSKDADGMEVAEAEDKWKATQNHLKQVRRYKDHGKILAVLQRAATHEAVFCDMAAFDSDPFLFNAANCVIDLRTGAQLAHAPELMLSKTSPVAYVPDAICPVWLDSLDTWFPGDYELQEYVQKAAGYTMTGSTEETCIFFAYGDGENGKSTCLKAIQEIMGQYASPVADGILSVREGSSNKSADVADLKGLRMAIASEAGDGFSLNESALKRLASDDTLKGRHLYQRHMAFDPTHKLWMNGNHRPIIKGSDRGVWRRWRVIPFDVPIPVHKLNKRIKDQLKAEYEGILAWMVAGAMLWQRDGLKDIPVSIQKATQEYKEDMDVLLPFFEKYVRDEPISRISSDELYQAYASWAVSSGIRVPMTTQALGRELKQKRGWVQKKSNGRNVWLGKKLTNTAFLSRPDRLPVSWEDGVGA